MPIPLLFRQSLLPKPTFWDEYGDLISAVIGITLLVSFFVYLAVSITGAHKITPEKQRKKKPKCQITLISHTVLTVDKGTEFVAPFPKKDGYDFGGWFYDSACTEPYKTKIVKKSFTLYPKWIKSS